MVLMMYDRLPEIDPMAKRKYKAHLNGSGISVWKCKTCDNELNDVTTKNIRKKYCDDCAKKQKRERDRQQALKRKNRIDN